MSEQLSSKWADVRTLQECKHSPEFISENSFCVKPALTLDSLSLRSMLPDVVDDFQVQNPNSSGHEALFYSFYVFFTKFASGVSLGISTLSLE